MKLPQIPQDKANHLVYGFGIYYISSFLTMFNQLIYFLIVLFFAIGKEIYSYISIKTKPDIYDVIATIAIPLLIIIKLIFKL
jgi:hypothetical protein